MLLNDFKTFIFHNLRFHTTIGVFFLLHLICIIFIIQSQSVTQMLQRFCFIQVFEYLALLFWYCVQTKIVLLWVSKSGQIVEMDVLSELYITNPHGQLLLLVLINLLPRHIYQLKHPIKFLIYLNYLLIFGFNFLFQLLQKIPIRWHNLQMWLLFLQTFTFQFPIIGSFNNFPFQYSINFHKLFPLPLQNILKVYLILGLFLLCVHLHCQVQVLMRNISLFCLFNEFLYSAIS